MKKVTLTVEIEFTDDVHEKYLSPLAQKVSNALCLEVLHGEGLNPDDEDSDAITDVITVTIPGVIQVTENPFNGKKLERTTDVKYL